MGGIVSSLYLGSRSGCCMEDLTLGWEEPEGSWWPWGLDGENIKGYLGGDEARIFLLSRSVPTRNSLRPSFQ